jgi:hypothetical protein
LPTHNAKQKKQKSHQANAQRHCKMTRQKTTEEEERTANTGLAKVAVQCSSATAETHLWLIKIWFSASIRQLADGENRHLLQAPNRNGKNPSML